jgi:hypothetical protein
MRWSRSSGVYSVALVDDDPVGGPTEIDGRLLVEQHPALHDLAADRGPQVDRYGPTLIGLAAVEEALL